MTDFQRGQSPVSWGNQPASVPNPAGNYVSLYDRYDCTSPQLFAMSPTERRRGVDPVPGYWGPLTPPAPIVPDPGVTQAFERPWAVPPPPPLRHHEDRPVFTHSHEAPRQGSLWPFVALIVAGLFIIGAVAVAAASVTP